MSFLKKLFGKTELVKEEQSINYNAFWDWFQSKEKSFFKAVQDPSNIEKDFFNHLSPKLAELKEGFFFLAGICAENTAELVFTADGIVKNIAFVEELVQAAPAIPGWKFTALKTALDIKNVSIGMGNYDFNSDNLFFYSNEHPDYPDEIDITVVYSDFNPAEEAMITNGVYIFLDNFLGELNFTTTIDNLTVIGKEDAEKELVPIEKLKDFLNWREKEFIEKYEATRYNTEKDNYATLQADLNNGKPLIAVINSSLLDWDAKASHPWILVVEIKYDGSQNKGLPNNKDFEFLNKFEDEIIAELKDVDGYLNFGRQTADGLRVFYFACKDFRKPSKVLERLATQYGNQWEISFDIYKDKYWQSFERYRVD